MKPYSVRFLLTDDEFTARFEMQAHLASGGALQ